MTQPYENYRSDRSTKFFIPEGNYLVRLCGTELTVQTVAERWHSEFRSKFHDAIWKAHHEKLDDLQARGLDLIVTTQPYITRADFLNSLIPFVRTAGTKSPAQIVHEKMEPLVLGPYVGVRSS